MDEQRDHAEEAANQRLIEDEDWDGIRAGVRLETLVMNYGSAFFAVSEAVDRRDGSTAAAVEYTGDKYAQVCERLQRLRALAYRHEGITVDARDAILSILDKE
jgi:hypothetical protein